MAETKMVIPPRRKKIFTPIVNVMMVQPKRVDSIRCL
jgi:hypothetical protein